MDGVVYRFATEDADHSDLAGGFVLRSAPGHPGFPVRLADEVFLRALDHLPPGPVTVWDPCCGCGALLTVLGLRHPDRIGAVLATDVDVDAVGLAHRNLDLLTPGGPARRADALRARHAAFGRAVHADAAAAADRLAAAARPVGTVRAVVADALDADALRGAVAGLPRPPDLVVTDVPYGRQTGWRGGGAAPLVALAAALRAVLPAHAVLAVVVGGRRVPLAPALERFRVGKRAGFVGRPADLDLR